MDRLILLRHGEAHARAASGSDLDRELTDAGRAAAAQAGQVLAAAGETPDAVVVSPAVRTRQTWDAARAAWPAPPGERVTRALYELPPLELLRTAEEKEAACVLLVGHNPGLHALACDRAGADGRLAQGYPPGTAAVLARGAKGWRLVCIHRPGDAS